jgi:signal transduction histidine kinase
MIAREGLYNSIRHAHPKKIQLTVEFEGEKCTFKIMDDGSGFDVRSLSKMPENHYGLLGIQERVERIHGTFNLQSAIGAGTQIAIEVPRKAIAPDPISEIRL